MITARPPYYIVRKNGRAHHEPPKWARQLLGAKGEALGYDGRKARALGWKFANELLELRDEFNLAVRNPMKIEVFPEGTLGHFFHQFTSRAMFREKAKNTQKDYWTCWATIRPTFGDWRLEDITTDSIEEALLYWDKNHSPYVRWKAIRRLKEMLAHAHARGLVAFDAGKVVRNPQPKGRTQTWLPHEIDKLITVGNHGDFGDLGLAIQLMYQTGLAPVDARNLSVTQLKKNSQAQWVEGTRQKSGKQFILPIDGSLYADLETRSVVNEDDGPLLRRAKGTPWENDEQFSRDFQALRYATFGHGEERQMRDIRRSYNVELSLGGATPEERAVLLANTLDKSDRLHETYTPPSVLRAQQLQKQREEGQALLQAEIAAG